MQGYKQVNEKGYTTDEGFLITVLQAYKKMCMQEYAYTYASATLGDIEKSLDHVLKIFGEEV